MKKTRTKLSNGLTVVIIEVPGSKSSVVSFLAKAGTRYNPKGKEGLAHFLEHIILKKTKDYPSELKLAEALETKGAFKNAWTNRENVNIMIQSSAKKLPTSLDILSGMIFHPLIDKVSVNAERGVIEKEQIKINSNPETKVRDLWYKIFFKGSPLEFSNLGTDTSINNIDKDSLLEFWGKYYKTQSSLLFISGRVDTDKTYNLAEKTFGYQILAKNTRAPLFEYEVNKHIVIERRKDKQTSMQLSFRLNKDLVDDLYPLRLLRAIMVAGWSSRISQTLRKEGLIYNWEGRVNRFLDTGAFAIKLSTAKDKFRRMLNILNEELLKIRIHKVSQKELLRVKGFLEGFLLSRVETSVDFHNWFAEDELLWPESVDNFEKYVRKIKNVTPEKILDIAKKYIRDDNWQIAIVGDIEESLEKEFESSPAISFKT
ncbi:insulinase family protein [Candidatus Woesebacteria bacterium]|nr:insulinase family protein [Candidatus Woesebacteria bacterium]